VGAQILTEPLLNIPESVRVTARDDTGAFFAPLSSIAPEVLVADWLDYSKSHDRARRLERYTTLANKKVLEIGVGYAVNLAAWIKAFEIDGYGVEPASQGFDRSYAAATELFKANNLDPSRIIDAPGEALPFPDASFDIVYSANVLEHVNDPEAVLREALRVVKPGGLIHMEIPNYLSYFEGHYMVPMPPALFRPMLKLWLRLLDRDPSFVDTLQLINPFWCARTVRKLKSAYPADLISLGESEFLHRLAEPLRFEAGATQSRLAATIRGLQSLNLGNWIGRLFVLLRAHYPIYMTLRRT
jgi:SAM-dependent methyltransferase